VTRRLLYLTYLPWAIFDVAAVCFLVWMPTHA
jgi:hypothetical protein